MALEFPRYSDCHINYAQTIASFYGFKNTLSEDQATEFLRLWYEREDLYQLKDPYYDGSIDFFVKCLIVQDVDVSNLTEGFFLDLVALLNEVPNPTRDTSYVEKPIESIRGWEYLRFKTGRD